MSMELSYTDVSNLPTQIRVRATRTNEIVTFDLNTPMRDFRNISIYATLNEYNPGSYKIIGNLYHNLDIYPISGTSKIINDIPVKLDLIIKSTTGGSNGVITYWLNETNSGYDKTFYVHVAKNNRYAQLTGGLLHFNKVNWNLYLHGQSTEKEISEIYVNASMKPDHERVNFKLDARTPWNDLQISKINVDSFVR